MLKKIPSNKVLFLDIETVPEVQNWSELSEEWKALWFKKIEKQLAENETPEEFYSKRAGILAEFGKIICISCGIIVEKNLFHLKSFYGDHESRILNEFNEMLAQSYFKNDLILCAHNG